MLLAPCSHALLYYQIHSSNSLSTMPNNLLTGHCFSRSFRSDKRAIITFLKFSPRYFSNSNSGLSIEAKVRIIEIGRFMILQIFYKVIILSIFVIKSILIREENYIIPIGLTIIYIPEATYFTILKTGAFLLVIIS
jgi:hypothetical protein